MLGSRSTSGVLPSLGFTGVFQRNVRLAAMPRSAGPELSVIATLRVWRNDMIEESSISTTIAIE